MDPAVPEKENVPPSVMVPAHSAARLSCEAKADRKVESENGVRIDMCPNETKSE